MINLVLLLLMLGAGALSLFIGPGGGFGLGGLWASDAETARLILFDIRLPSVITGLMVGFTLGMGGAALQGLLRNPLAEPGTLGTAGGAALGAVATFYFGLFGLGTWALPIGGIVGGVAALAVVLAIAGLSGSTATLILAGIAVSLFTGAATSLLLNLAANPFAIYEILFWTMGSLADRSWQHVAMVVPFAVLGLGLVGAQARAFDALTLGEDTATSLGVSVRRLRLSVVLGVGLSVGAAVAVAGVISFVGLIVPHFMRALTGQQPGRALVPSGLAGAVLLTLADIGTRLIPTSGEPLRLGVLTALLGAPFFVWLILRARRREGGV